MRPVALAMLVALAGCGGDSHPGSLRMRWPEASEVGRAAVEAAKSPRTWGPLAVAALLSGSDLDEGISDRIATEQPLFGSRAAAASDILAEVAVAAFAVSALAAPGARPADRLGVLGMGAATLYAQGGVVEGALKQTFRRLRPGGDGVDSFPSGHASAASTAATLASRNLEYIELSPATRVTAVAGIEATAIATGWARVEARRHFVADVLAGYAVGHFFATFAHRTFVEGRRPGTVIDFRPAKGGGLLRVALPFGASRGGGGRPRPTGRPR